MTFLAPTRAVFETDLLKTLIGTGGLIGIAVAFVAAFKAIYEMHQSTEQRKIELRWKQANTAKDMLHEIHCHPLASSAVRMLDWSEGQHSYKLESGNEGVISYEIVRGALSKSPASCSEVETYIRDCFDWFFYFVDRIEHAIQINLITDVDVLPVFTPYDEKLRADGPMYDAFLAAHRYLLARKFFDRYAQPRTARRRPPRLLF